MNSVIARNFFVVNGNLLQGNTLISSSSSNINYIIDVVEVFDSNRLIVKVRRPNSRYYLCSYVCSGISFSVDGIGSVVSELIEKYDL